MFFNREITWKYSQISDYKADCKIQRTEGKILFLWDLNVFESIETPKFVNCYLGRFRMTVLKCMLIKHKCPAVPSYWLRALQELSDTVQNHNCQPSRNSLALSPEFCVAIAFLIKSFPVPKFGTESVNMWQIELPTQALLELWGKCDFLQNQMGKLRKSSCVYFKLHSSEFFYSFLLHQCIHWFVCDSAPSPPPPPQPFTFLFEDWFK